MECAPDISPPALGSSKGYHLLSANVKIYRVENCGDVVQNYQNFCIIESESFEQRPPILVWTASTLMLVLGQIIRSILA